MQLSSLSKNGMGELLSLQAIRGSDHGAETLLLLFRGLRLPVQRKNFSYTGKFSILRLRGLRMGFHQAQLQLMIIHLLLLTPPCGFSGQYSNIWRVAGMMHGSVTGLL